MTTPGTATPDMELLAKNLYDEMERLGKSSEAFARLAASRMDVQIGQTPKEVIWTLNKMKLYHYYPQTPPE